MSLAHLDMEVTPADWTAEKWVEMRWNDPNQDPYFHRKEYSPSLVKYYSDLFPGDGRGRVFFPLCGKSLDIVFMADRGHEVVGLEYSVSAVERFFGENALTYTKEKLEDKPLHVYSAKEKNIKIYQGDLFEIDRSICGQFDATFDRGSYVAINVGAHKAYGEIMASIVKPGGAILMEAITYTSATFRGPPHSILEEDLAGNFPDFSIRILEAYTKKTFPQIVVNNQEVDVRVTLLKRK